MSLPKIIVLLAGIVIGVFLQAAVPATASFISGNYDKYKEHSKQKFEEEAQNYCRVNQCSPDII